MLIGLPMWPLKCYIPIGFPSQILQVRGAHPPYVRASFPSKVLVRHTAHWREERNAHIPVAKVDITHHQGNPLTGVS